jgi:hypothetical protein
MTAADEYKHLIAIRDAEHRAALATNRRLRAQLGIDHSQQTANALAVLSPDRHDEYLRRRELEGV